MSDNATDVTTPPDDSNEGRASGEAPIGFERAEYDAAPATTGEAMTCGICRSGIEARYHVLNSRAICTRCAAVIEGDLAYARSRSALWGSIGWGILAAVAGAIVWILIGNATGYELGLVAVGVGYVVGKSVRRGSRGVGGRRFQVIAMMLTFFAITVAHVPSVLRAVRESARSHATAPANATPSEDGPRTESRPNATTSTTSTTDEHRPPVSLGTFVLAWLLLLGLAAVLPLLGLPQSAMGLVIIGIALYEAWKFTRALPIAFNGPFDAPTRTEPAPSV